MTNPLRSTGFRASVVSVAVTASVLLAVLLMQHLRHGWPFSLHHGVGQTPAGATAARQPAASGTHTGHERVPIDVDASRIDAMGIRLEVVGGETLTQPLRAVATIVPDEARISHAHTRVAGWVEELLVNTTGQTVRAGEPLARSIAGEPEESLDDAEAQWQIVPMHETVG